MNNVIVGLSICIALMSLGYAFYQRYNEKKLMKKLIAMLDEAISGTYKEDNYDESLMSALEVRLSRFLNGSKLSYKNVEAERNRIRTLISDISHQTKTPVANIRLFSEILLEMQLEENAGQAALQINSQVEKLQFLIDVLLKMSRMENGIITVEPKIQKVNSLVESVYEQIYPKALEEEIELELQTTEDLAAFDMKWTSEALYNIVDNAVKYTPKSGKVIIRIVSYEIYCRIDVIDNGIGIMEEEQSKIFTRFYRSKDVNQIQGIGVGLYLSREIVSRQNGYIVVKSEKGKGSTFSIFLLKS